MRRASSLAFALIFGYATMASAEDTPINADLVLTGGTIYDGSGAEGVIGDVAIADKKIVAVGKFKHGKVLQKINCTGLVIAPGFIDLHNHSDGPIVSPATRGNVNYLTQGCTTIVTGNCGSGPIRVKEFYDKVDAAGSGTHVAHLLPQGSLREFVMQRVSRKPTEEELAKMRDLASKAMEEGAWGMSTGLIYIPGTFCETEELAEIAKVVGSRGGIYASHIRNESKQLVESIEEAMRIGREGKMPVHISHFKASGSDAWGQLRIAVAAIEKARTSGEKVTADQYPYIASSTSLEATLLPTWAGEGGRKKLEERLKDTETRAKIKAAVEKDLQVKRRIQIASFGPNPEYVGKSLDEIAAAEKRPVVDLVLDIESRGGARIINFGMNEEEVRMAMQLAWVATASDGAARIPDQDQPHPRNYGTFSRKFGLYSLKEKVVPLAAAIRSSSGLPADILGLTDRGYLRPGLAADIAVFDPKTFVDTATYDLPARYSTGIKYVFVAGTPAIFEGTPTGALAGRGLRRRGAMGE
ncbi:MAG: N-acyl-D-amino-acid deacylase family protein [Pirellulaceae bacterium]